MSLTNYKLKSLKDKLNEQAEAEAKKRAEAKPIKDIKKAKKVDEEKTKK